MRAHSRSREWQGNAVALLTGLFDGIWLGSLDERHFRELDDAFYGKRAREDVRGEQRGYLDPEYTRSGLHDWELAAIRAGFPAAGRVVVTSAGGGREVLALLEAGYDAVGYEPNAALVEAGCALLESLGHPARLHASPRDAFPPEVERCDAIVIGWGSYMHVIGRDRRVALLRRARRSLDLGGPVLLSFLMRPPERRYFRVSAAVANGVRSVRRAAPIEVGDCLRTTWFHLFTREEIASELAAAGFRLERLRSKPYGHALAVAE